MAIISNRQQATFEGSIKQIANFPLGKKPLRRGFI